MTPSLPPSVNYRELLAHLERAQERVRDENEYLRLDREVEEVARRAERDLREQLGALIPGNAVRWVLPANSDPLVPQDPARRAQFEEHLAAITEGAVLDQERLEVDPLDTDLEAKGPGALSASVCAACRGSCCRSGGDQAYLTEETMLRSLLAHPDWSVAQIRDSYLRYLPTESVENSCIYHSATGCGLPRALRSSTCNRYLCGKLRNLQASLPEQDPPPILAMMFDKGQWTRTALVDRAGFKVLDDLAPGSDRSP